MNISFAPSRAVLDTNACWPESVAESLATRSIPVFKKQAPSVGSVLGGTLPGNEAVSILLPELPPEETP